MPTTNTAALAPIRAEAPIEGTVVDGDLELDRSHILTLGGEEFVCGPKLPVGTLIRHADNDLLSMHHILVKLVDPDDHDRMWDAFEDLDEEEIGTAIGDLVESYSDRPTQPPSRSAAGPKRTRRK